MLHCFISPRSLYGVKIEECWEINKALHSLFYLLRYSVLAGTAPKCLFSVFCPTQKSSKNQSFQKTTARGHCSILGPSETCYQVQIIDSEIVRGVVLEVFWESVRANARRCPRRVPGVVWNVCPALSGRFARCYPRRMRSHVQVGCSALSPRWPPDRLKKPQDGPMMVPRWP